MPILANTRHEMFAHGIALGLSPYRAYTEAGYEPKTYASAAAAGSRLLRDVKIASRIAELKTNAAEKVSITLQSATIDLMRIARKAEDLKDAAGLSTARAAMMDVYKMNGIAVDKSKVDIGFDFDFTQCTDEELPVALKMLARMAAARTSPAPATEDEA